MDGTDDRVARGLDELVAVVQAQAARIDELERRLASSSPSVEPAAPPPEPPRPDRRSLLRSAGLATAGALGGAAVLAQASPAAAAQATFDGNPAVLGTANPTSGVGVRGDTGTGTGVLGVSTSPTGGGIGVQGTVASPDAVGVGALNTATTGTPTAMRATVVAPDGLALSALNSATTGFPVAVKATASAVAGVAIHGEASSTAVAAPTELAVGVKGTAASTRGIGVVGMATRGDGTTMGVRALCASPEGYALNAFNGTTATGDGLAVMATTNGGAATALLARANSSSGATVGVRAIATLSALGTGLIAQGSKTGMRADAAIADGSAVEIGFNRTALRFTNPNPPPLANPSPGTFAVGDIVYDTAGDLWICTAAGTPGSWRRLGGTSTAGALVLLNTPVRVYDSRPGEVPLNSTKGPITGNTTRVIDMKNNSSGVPAGASGVLCSLTVVNTSANGGFLALFRNGAATPATSTVNWTAANQVVATTTVTAVDATAQAKVFCPPNSSTNFFVDVIGFYQ